MSRYECYFDGSYRPAMSCSAFCIKVDDQIIHTGVYHEKFTSALQAEIRALYMLLQHIKQDIEPGSTVDIFGDAQSVIDKMNAMTKRRVRNKTKKLFSALQRDYELTLTYIPRTMNKIAHKLSQTKYSAPLSSPELPNPQQSRRYSTVQCKTMLLDDIVIFDSIKNSKPKDTKYQKRLLFYREHGYVYRTIQVTADGFLLDGYISYLILKEDGKSECNVEVLS